MGETGSGKTTQLPQYIQDARLINGQIGVTQVCFILSRQISVVEHKYPLDPEGSNITYII